MQKRNLRSKTGSLFITAGVLLILTAVIWVGENQWTARQAGIESEVIMEQMDRGPIGTCSKWVIDEKKYAGVLEIPALSLTLPVLKEWSYNGLKTAPCRYRGQAATGDLVIAGHNYRRHFSGIKNVKTGTGVIFTDAGGDRYCYTVVRSEVISSDDVNGMVNASDWDLTLFTCTRGGSARYALRCRVNSKS